MLTDSEVEEGDIYSNGYIPTTSSQALWYLKENNNSIELLDFSKVASEDEYNYDYDYLQMEIQENHCVRKFQSTEENDTSANDWHEERINKRTVIDKMIEEYINSFTLHGLTKVFIARSKLESLFWLVMLLSGILLSAYVSISLVGKYLSYEVYTEIKFQITDKNYFPAITICEKRHLTMFYYAWCGHPNGEHPRGHEPCKHLHFVPQEARIATDNKTWWSNGIFNITSCSTWGGKSCVNDRYLRSFKGHNQSCVTWNYDGGMFDVYSHVDIEFTYLRENAQIDKYPDVVIIAHDARITEIDLTNAISIEPKKYDINLEKTVVERLPYPFPAQCTDRQNNSMLPGKYTRRECLETKNYVAMYKECGGTLDYIMQFLPKVIMQEELHRHRSNGTVNEILACMRSFGKQEANSSSTDCPFPCSEVDVNMLVSSRDYFPEEKGNKSRINSTYMIGVQYLKVDSYRLVKEKQLYSGYQMACEIGGLIGLMVGCSLLSGIEIFVCFILWIIKQLSSKL